MNAAGDEALLAGQPRVRAWSLFPKRLEQSSLCVFSWPEARASLVLMRNFVWPEPQTRRCEGLTSSSMPASKGDHDAVCAKAQEFLKEGAGLLGDRLPDEHVYFF